MRKVGMIMPLPCINSYLLDFLSQVEDSRRAGGWSRRSGLLSVGGGLFRAPFFLLVVPTLGASLDVGAAPSARYTTRALFLRADRPGVRGIATHPAPSHEGGRLSLWRRSSSFSRSLPRRCAAGGPFLAVHGTAGAFKEDETARYLIEGKGAVILSQQRVIEARPERLPDTGNEGDRCLLFREVFLIKKVLNPVAVGLPGFVWTLLQAGPLPPQGV